MIALKRYALRMALLSSLHTPILFALDSVEGDIGEIILPDWGHPTFSLEEFFETLGLVADSHTLAFFASYLL